MVCDSIARVDFGFLIRSSAERKRAGRVVGSRAVGLVGRLVHCVCMAGAFARARRSALL